jgi:YD repeat-containing protein
MIARGNMISGMNHLASMAYNEVNQLQTVIDASGTITTYYQYDYEGQRVRKVSINTGANQTQTRKYFGYWEVYDKIDNSTGSIIIERESLQIMDDSSRIALIDTPTIDTTGGGEAQLLRYQFSNNLSTATLELDDSAAVISQCQHMKFILVPIAGNRFFPFTAAACSARYQDDGLPMPAYLYFKSCVCLFFGKQSGAMQQ